MPKSLTNVMEWGGSGVAIVFAIAVIYEVMVARPPRGGESGAPVTLFLVLIVAGSAAAILGWLLEGRKGSAGS